MSSESFHESTELLSEATQDLHRAIVSLKEELDAVDWYQQRAEACADAELRAILLHNKDEEVEHAMMIMEWLRRRSRVFADHVDTYMNTSGPIVDIEKGGASSKAAGTEAGTKAAVENHERVSLGIGSLKEVE